MINTCIGSLKRNITWQKAEEHCNSLNSHLLSLEGEHLQNVVENVEVDLGTFMFIGLKLKVSLIVKQHDDCCRYWILQSL